MADQPDPKPQPEPIFVYEENGQTIRRFVPGCADGGESRMRWLVEDGDLE